jgi:hypothetical protein
MLHIIITGILLLTGLFTKAAIKSPSASETVEICLKTNRVLKKTNYYSKTCMPLFQKSINRQTKHERETI